MYELKIIQWFSAAHFLRHYHGRCENLHGHNWKVEVMVEGKTLGESGMLLDFREIKKITEKILAPLDHQLLNRVKPFNRINPTAENLASYLFNQLIKYQKLSAKKIRVKAVRVWESENSCATYHEG